MLFMPQHMMHLHFIELCYSREFQNHILLYQEGLQMPSSSAIHGAYFTSRCDNTELCVM